MPHGDMPTSAIDFFPGVEDQSPPLHTHQEGKDDPTVLFSAGSVLHNMPKHLMCLFSPHEVELLQIADALPTSEMKKLIDSPDISDFSPTQLELRQFVRDVCDDMEGACPTPFLQALVAVCKIKFMTDETASPDVRVLRKLAVHMDKILENSVEDVRQALGKLELGGGTLADCNVTTVNFFSSGSEKTVPSIKVSITVGYAQPGEIETASRGELMGDQKDHIIIGKKTIN